MADIVNALSRPTRADSNQVEIAHCRNGPGVRLGPMTLRKVLGDYMKPVAEPKPSASGRRAARGRDCWSPPRHVIADASKVPGWMSQEELRLALGPGRASLSDCGVGSWQGRSTKALAQSTPGIRDQRRQPRRRRPVSADSSGGELCAEASHESLKVERISQEGPSIREALS